MSSKYQKELKHLLYGSHLPNITITIIFFSIPMPNIIVKSNKILASQSNRVQMDPLFVVPRMKMKSFFVLPGQLKTYVKCVYALKIN